MTAAARTYVVTGGSRGLGRALVEALAEGGDAVVTDARDPVALDAAVRGLLRVRAVPGDLTDPVHRSALVAAAGAAFHGLVLNAGTLGPSPLPALDAAVLAEVRDAFETNVVAQLALVQEALPRLRAGGRIVAITSDAAAQAYPGWGVYGATKAALEHLVAVLAVERPDLRVHAVDPGDLRTSMQQAAFPGQDISDRPEPETAVPALLRLLDEDVASGRHRAADLAPMGAS